MDRTSRIAYLRAVMEENALEAILLTDPADVFYYSGFAGTPGDAALLLTRTENFILTDSRYTLQAGEQCPAYTLLGTSASDFETLASCLSERKIRTAGFENETVSYRLWQRFTQKTKDVCWQPLGDLVRKKRERKEADEIAMIGKACDVACAALSETLPLIRPGISERDVAAELEYRMKKKGASGPSFDTIVASGARSALPHGLASSKIICAGDAVTVDFGAIYQGYCSDMTRTFFVGEPDAELKKIYRTVLSAQLAAISGYREGMKARELDEIARSVIRDAGYGECFGHALGHGVGIEIHEGVSVSTRSEAVLTDGMVFSIEPGIYVAGLGGVRIEDLVCAENGTLRILTSSFKKELAIL